MAARDGPGRGRSPRLPLLVLAGLAVGLLLGLAAARFLLPPARLAYRDLPRVEAPLPGAGVVPRAVAETAAAGPPPLAGERPPDPAAPPLDPEDALAEPGPWGLVPRIGPDGRRPFDVYRRRDGTMAEGPRLALVIRGLGLDRDATLAAARLPAPVALAFSPYAPALAAWLRHARGLGHEVLVEVPLRAADPATDPGPLAVDPAAGPGGLLRLLARAPGTFAVVLGSPPEDLVRLDPLVAELGRRGLGLLEPDPAARLAPLAARHRVPYGVAAVVLDAEPDPAAVDFALGRLETAAERRGAAIGVSGPLPLVLERLVQWLPGLAPRGFVLVPPGRILAEGAPASP